MAPITRILIVGGGYVGMTCALRLQRRLRPSEATVTVVDRHSTMTYQPFLAEVAGGSIEPRHVVVPLRKVLHGCEVVTARVSAIDVERRVAIADAAPAEEVRLPYDVLVLAPGSVSRSVAIPGLAEHAIGFTTLGEAVHLRNRVLGQLDAASALADPDRRRAALTFTVVGAGYSGVELIAELEDMARAGLRYYPHLRREELRWTLVEASDRILPEVSVSLAGYTRDRLVARGIQVKLGTRLQAVDQGRLQLSDGDHFQSDTLVWTAGVGPNPLLARLALPVNLTGRLVTGTDLRVDSVAAVWAAGDAAAVPDLTVTGHDAICGPSAQHAVRQAKLLARNVLAELRGRPLKPYRHADAGSVASLGLHQGVAQVYGVRLRGWPAWMLHRLYHLSQAPTTNRKARVLADWALTSIFHREAVSLTQIEQPREPWTRAALAARTGDVELPPIPR